MGKLVIPTVLEATVDLGGADSQVLSLEVLTRTNVNKTIRRLKQRIEGKTKYTNVHFGPISGRVLWKSSNIPIAKFSEKLKAKRKFLGGIGKGSDDFLLMHFGHRFAIVGEQALVVGKRNGLAEIYDCYFFS